MYFAHRHCLSTELAVLLSPETIPIRNAVQWKWKTLHFTPSSTAHSCKMSGIYLSYGWLWSRSIYLFICAVCQNNCELNKTIVHYSKMFALWVFYYIKLNFIRIVSNISHYALLWYWIELNMFGNFCFIVYHIYMLMVRWSLVRYAKYSLILNLLTAGSSPTWFAQVVLSLSLAILYLRWQPLEGWRAANSVNIRHRSSWL